jgi:addiction module HigA family antidote
MQMHDPPHPGLMLRALWLKPLDLSVSSLAAHIQVSRKTVSEIVNGKASISADMALRLSTALGTTPQVWLDMQQAHDLWHASQRPRPAIGRLVAAEASAAVAGVETP